MTEFWQWIPKVIFLCNLFLAEVDTVPIEQNNVCRTYRAYANIQQNKNCYYNPDADSSPSQIAKRYGFALTNYLVTTEDGYIITVFRLMPANASLEDSSRKQPVVLQHGILVDAVSWIISGENSIAFNLVNNGFDLWMPNFRGSAYSNRHVNSSITEKDYWNFSFHEMGIFDIPATIDLVSKTTNFGNKKIIFIGHSMGSTASFVYSTLKTDHAQKHLKGMIALAPVVFTSNVEGITRIIAPFAVLIKNFLEKLGIYAVGQFPELEKQIVSKTCSRYPLILPCQLIYGASSGLVVEQLRPDLLPIILTIAPTGTSTKTLLHYGQLVVNGGSSFRWYDYGVVRNKMLYNSTVPPEYDVEKFSLPIYVFIGKNDFLSTQKDVKYLLSKVKCPKGLEIQEIAHSDFAYGKHVESLYKDIVAVLRDTKWDNCDI